MKRAGNFFLCDCSKEKITELNLDHEKSSLCRQFEFIKVSIYNTQTRSSENIIFDNFDLIQCRVKKIARQISAEQHF